MDKPDKSDKLDRLDQWDKLDELDKLDEKRSKEWNVNSFLFNNDLQPAWSKGVSRLIVAGQDLRGGDPRCTPEPTPFNCCVACLESGVKVAETLHHVTFMCPHYADLRSNSAICDILASLDVRAFCLHRDVWSWRQLKALRTYFGTLVMRRNAHIGHKRRSFAPALQSHVAFLW